MRLEPAATGWARPVITGTAIVLGRPSSTRTTGYAGTAAAGIAEHKKPAAAPKTGARKAQAEPAAAAPRPAQAAATSASADLFGGLGPLAALSGDQRETMERRDAAAHAWRGPRIVVKRRRHDVGDSAPPRMNRRGGNADAARYL